MVGGGGMSLRRVNFRADLGALERARSETGEFDENSRRRGLGRLQDEQVRGREHPSVAPRRNASRVEGAEVVPRRIWIEPPHQDLGGVLRGGQHDERAQAEAIGRHFRHAEPGGGGRPAEPAEPPVGGHGTPHRAIELSDGEPGGDPVVLTPHGAAAREPTYSSIPAPGEVSWAGGGTPIGVAEGRGGEDQLGRPRAGGNTSDPSAAARASGTPPPCT
jgi:hypothetical protein